MTFARLGYVMAKSVFLLTLVLAPLKMQSALNVNAEFGNMEDAYFHARFAVTSYVKMTNLNTKHHVKSLKLKA